MSVKNILEGRIRQLFMKPSASPPARTYAPPNGKCWLILGGAGWHVTGTDTEVYVTGRPDQVSTFTEQTRDILCNIGGAIGSGFFNVPSNGKMNVGGVATDMQLSTPWYPILVTNMDCIRIAGDASTTLNLKVLEFDV